MYTLGMFHIKFYVCNSCHLMPLIQKHSKTLSFRPFMQLSSRKFGDANDDTYRLMGGKLVDEFSQAQKSSLSPGPHLDVQNLRMGEQLIIELEGLLDVDHGSSKNVKLFKWVKDAVVQASSCGIYGANHPFRDPAVEKAFWLGSRLRGINLECVLIIVLSHLGSGRSISQPNSQG